MHACRAAVLGVLVSALAACPEQRTTGGNDPVGAPASSSAASAASPGPSSARTASSAGAPSSSAGAPSSLAGAPSSFAASSSAGAASASSGGPVQFTYATPDAVYVLGSVIAPNTPVGAEGATAFAVTPALPVGLVLDAATGVITGQPAAVSPRTEFGVTASGPSFAGHATLAVTVVDVPPLIVTYSEPIASYRRGDPITPNVPSLTGGTPLAFTAAPSLPPGLVLHALTGVVSGIPTDVAARSAYVITAANSGGQSDFTLYLAVLDPPAPFAYAEPEVTWALGVDVTPNLPVGAAGANSFTVDPPLPNGLLMDAVTGAISGRPNVLSPRTTYVVTAHNDVGATTSTVNIAVKPPCGFTCAPAVEPGWSGPVAAHAATAASACPPAWPTPELAAYAGITGASASCPCSCAAECALRVRRYLGRNCLGLPLVFSEVVTETMLQACQDISLASNVDSATVALETGGQTCAATGTSSTAPWTALTTLSACTGAGPVDHVCAAGGTCWPDTAPFPAPLCIHQDGDLACPAAWPVRALYHRDALDGRSCTACTCNRTGNCAITSIAAWADTRCTLRLPAPLDNLTVGQECVDRGAATGTVSVAISGNFSGAAACTATASPTGEVTASGPVTFCCQPG
ncbi:MAG: putative Ig domain-containing protein [Deltaproteobacteria bacterium]|nr:putative Ig domain-containing protein [Deltaproteobacteria bacterium]